MGILFLSVKLHGQPIKLLTGRVLKILPSEPQVVTLRFEMGSCGSLHVMDILASGTPKLGRKKITLNRTNPIALGMWNDGYHWNCVVILSHQRLVTGLALAGCVAQVFTGLSYVGPSGCVAQIFGPGFYLSG